MEFGIPKEILPQEGRVGLTPAGAYTLIAEGHKIYVEKGAGVAAGFSDENYQRAGCTIVYSAEEVYGRASVILKVTKIQPKEYGILNPGQIILCFLHFAVASRGLKAVLSEQKITAIAYELIQDRKGNYPILDSLSQVAGRLAPYIAGDLLSNQNGGKGVLISGISGVPSAEVVVIGAGTVGYNAIRAFIGAGAQVTVLDTQISTLNLIDHEFGGRVPTMFSNPYNISRVLKFADVVVGAILIPGQRAPVVITREMVRGMRSRSVFIDYSIDQGGCSETSRPSSLENPVYIEEDVLHFAVPNLTSRVARTASHALSNAYGPYVFDIGKYGLEEAMKRRTGIRNGVQVLNGEVVA